MNTLRKQAISVLMDLHKLSTIAKRECNKDAQKIKDIEMELAGVLLPLINT